MLYATLKSNINDCLILFFQLHQVSCDRGHFVLTTEALEGKRVFVLGDVHGCFEELVNVLDNAEAIDRSGNYDNT